MAKRLRPARTTPTWTAGDAWPDRLGDAAAWPVYRDLFRQWLAHEGVGDGPCQGALGRARRAEEQDVLAGEDGGETAIDHRFTLAEAADEVGAKLPKQPVTGHHVSLGSGGVTGTRLEAS